MKMPSAGERVQVGATVVSVHLRPGQPEETAQVSLQLTDGQGLVTSVGNLAAEPEPEPAREAAPAPPRPRRRE